MEVGHGQTDGSLVSLKEKPPVKGRKKKSAVAKLVEKKRRSSECGSEYGSTVSLQKEVESTQSKTIEAQEVEKPKDLNSPKSADSNNRLSKDDCNEKSYHIAKGVKNETNDIGVESASELTTKSSKPDLENKTDNKIIDNESPPKPVPRKLNRRKPVEKNPFTTEDIESGTVVSIYEKRDRTPTRNTKRDSSPSAVHGSKTEDTDTKPSTRRELNYKSEKKQDETLGNIFSLLGPGKPRSGLAPLDDLPPLDGGPSQKDKNIDLSPPVPMDIDNDSNEDNKNGNQNSDVISKNAPSDATVHRFRAMRMTPDRSRSEESLKNAQFAPKPPSTPRSARKSSTKGEKRNREANSSGEEADKEAKKQNSVDIKLSDNIVNTSLSNLQMSDKMEVDSEVIVPSKEVTRKGLSVHPNVKEVKDIAEFNVNQNMNEPEETNSEETINRVINASGIYEDISPDKNFNISPDKLAFESSPEKDVLSETGKKSRDTSGKKSDKKRTGKKNKVKPSHRNELAPLDGSDAASPGKSSIDTIGSASDLKAISEQYEQVLNKDESPIKKSDQSRPSTSGFNSDSVIPEPKSNAGKLTPIQPKSLPPPLPHDIKSTSLRTSYKTDPAQAMTKFFGRSFSGNTEKEKTKYEMLSARSLSHSSALPALPTREARDRMRHGAAGTSLLSSTELDRYFPDRKVGLWIGSWNMAEIKDCKEPLDDFLLPEVSEYVQDIYAIGTQENAMNKKEWEILLQETIGPSHVLFHSASHGALHLAVFVKRDLIWFCTVPEDDLVQTRAVTMVKTKGAIAIGFQFFGTSFLFINCHFAPGDEKKKERLDDFIKIIKHLNLPKQGSSGSPSSNANDVTTRYDSVFWMGDLNFRIEVYKGKQAVEDIVKYIEEQEHRNFEDLVSGDQLTKLIVEGSIFQGFQEGRINFRPTYKYDIGEDTFDTSSKNRIPSYTDRVLFRAKKKNSITCTHYDSPRNVKISDHRPVFAIFEVAVQPARECNLPLAAGQFDRNVYTEANRRRTLKVEVIKTFQQEKSTKVCSIQ